uniref:Cathepsin O n=1 Tax=Sinocyclocheilus anshuiensis TaxID=1608454 RepID=A0A671KZX7_9TELE
HKSLNAPWIPRNASSLKRQAFLNSALKKSNHSARYGINQLSDLSPQQFKCDYMQTASNFDPSRSGIQVKMNYPPKFDWRDYGFVGPVRNKESCGGCWAFSVVEAIETVSAKDGGKLQQLSVQQVIDCSYENEGSPTGDLDWLTQTKLKLVNEAEYPFKDEAGICQYFPQSHAGVAVRNYSAYDFSGQEEVMTMCWWSRGLISWQDYLGGIIQHNCSSHNTNHAVLITGCDTTGKVPYWIVRNSWGTSWGDNRYAYIKIGNDMCGIVDNVAAVFV